MSNNIYTDLSEERKYLQSIGELPEWYTTGGYQLFVNKYRFDNATVKTTYQRIAYTAASHLPKDLQGEAYIQFFNLLWKGWLSPATPVYNMGTNAGLVVSCAGGYIEDSISGFYNHALESAVLSQEGFGTSGYLGDIRPRGSNISRGGKASGVLPTFKMLVQMTSDVTQGTKRRGAWAGYLPINHDDFNELSDYILNNSDGANIGWNIYDKDIVEFNKPFSDLNKRLRKSLKLKMVAGKGYYFFPDKANRHRPQMYKDHNLDIKASNLCSEITLHSSSKYTFTCVLSSMNASKYIEWKDTQAVFWSTIFLDCVAEEFITKSKGISELEKAINFTKKGRALGLGVCGFHTYLQNNNIPYESLDATYFNNELFNHIKTDSLKASKWMAELLGEPEWCKGYGVRNTHRTAVAPTKTTALLMGGISEGINPDPAMVYLQLTSGGEVIRVNPSLLKIMKERNVFTKEILQEIENKFGSVQWVSWLSQHEKLVFKTAFEINQEVVIRLASQRQRNLCQGQSINLHFPADTDPAWISHIHKLAFEDENILSLYYITTMAGIHASQQNTECIACQ